MTASSDGAQVQRELSAVRQQIREHEAALRVRGDAMDELGAVARQLPALAQVEADLDAWQQNGAQTSLEHVESALKEMRAELKPWTTSPAIYTVIRNIDLALRGVTRILMQLEA